MNITLRILLHQNDKFAKGYINELLVLGNLSKFGFTGKVLHDNNPNFDIVICKHKKKNYIECKLDLFSRYSPNFYFEVWNYTYNRPTGIINEDMQSLFSYTYFRDNKPYLLIARRKIFKETLQKIMEVEPNKINAYYRKYRNGFISDKAFIVNADTFLKYFTGFKIEIKPSFASIIY